MREISQARTVYGGCFDSGIDVTLCRWRVGRCLVRAHVLVGFSLSFDMPISCLQRSQGFVDESCHRFRRILFLLGRNLRDNLIFTFFAA